jgi:dimethylargininase
MATPKLLAITHLPSPRLQACQRTFIPTVEIDSELAVRQHERYRQVLCECGADIVALDHNIALPDSAFIEDTAIVLDEVAILGSMGAPSRRAEPAAIESELRKHRTVVRVDPPATLEGGDVLRIGKRLLVGLSARTNQAGIVALRQITAPHGYHVLAVPVHGCLHLKTACTALPDQSLLVNPKWIQTDVLGSFSCHPVPDDEPWGANLAFVGATIVMPCNHPQTGRSVESRGFHVRTVDISEFQKAEGGVTCLAVFVRASPPPIE